MGKSALKNVIGMATPHLKGLLMPIYEFKCPLCGDLVEQSFHVYVTPKINCGNCGCEMEKQFSSPAVHFKGDGWASKEK
jgi:putative FmdB family regulatory protein